MFAHKYRPRTWDEIMGNAANIKRLKFLAEGIKDQDQALAMLFVGPSGTGKTTCARIFGNVVNDGDVSEQNVIEFDGATSRGIDDARELGETSRLRPMHGNYRVYIIDEFHLLTPQAKKAYLKIIEDAPKHTVFIICTTAPGELPKEILGRCQKFNFSFPTRDELKPLVTAICRAEGMDMNKQVFDLIIRGSGGSTREFVQHLDAIHQLGATTPEDLEKVVIQYFGRDAGRYDAAVAFAEAKNVSEAIKCLGEVDNCFDFTSTLLDVCAQQLDKHINDLERLAEIRRLIKGVIVARSQMQTLIGVDAKMILVANLV